MNNFLRASLFLETNLLFNLIIHGIAMLSMAILLLPGMPGGTSPDDATRIAYIASHPWLWRLGWLPWQLTAVSDLVLALALLKTHWIPRLPAALVLVLTLIAIVFEQPGEFWWITGGISLAQQAQASNILSVFLDHESAIFVRVAAWAAIFYTLAAIGWSFCFALAGTWNRAMTWLSVLTWSILMAVSVAPILPPGVRPGSAIISSGNALGFLLLMIWLTVVLELVLRRARPFTAYGREAPWHHPAGGLAACMLDSIANSRLLRFIGELMPSPAFVSDITDVVYVNYLVPAESLIPLVPPGLELDRIGPDGQFGLFTFLSYNHGHFGPRMLGPLRKLLPSPLQSNWRIHVHELDRSISGIYFITTGINNTINALAARLLSDGVPMHVFDRAEITNEPDGSIRMSLESGTGTAPDVAATFTAGSDSLPPPWNRCFSTYQDFLEYCVPQDRALSSQPWYRRICRHEIALNIPISSCEPLLGTVRSKTASLVAGNGAQPICFRVARVNFLFDRTEYDRF